MTSDNPTYGQGVTKFFCAECVPSIELANERAWHDHIRLIHPRTHVEIQATKFRNRPKLPRDDDRFDEELFS